MKGSEKINPSKFIKSKYIKEATLDVLSGVAFFVLCYNVVMRVLDTPRSLVRLIGISASLCPITY